MHRAQQGIELMVVFATALAIFVLFYSIFAQQYGDSVRRQAQNDGVSLAKRMVEEINLAARSGDGYSRRVTYPPKISGAINYWMKVNTVSGSVDITLDLGNQNFTYSAMALTRNITGEPQYASVYGDGYDFEIPRGAAYVENRGGIIVINQTKAVG